MTRKLYHPFNPLLPYIHNEIITTSLQIGDWVEDLGSGNIYQLQTLPLNSNTLTKLLLINGLFWTECGIIKGIYSSDN